jgi:hypothetical protein
MKLTWIRMGRLNILDGEGGHYASKWSDGLKTLRL